MIRVLVAEDVGILREALSVLLDQEADLAVVAAVETGDKIVPTALRYRPHVAVIDIAMPNLDGLDAAAELHERLPECRALILTGVGRPGDLRRAAQAHVAGFMLKDSKPDELVAAIRTIAAGGRVIDAQLAYATLDAASGPLTDRENDVLRLTADGASPREVAASLHLSYGTVRNYLASVVTKLGARNRVDAIRIARGAGWL